MNMSANACTDLAFDNFDRFFQTLTGIDTLHDTVGMAYETLKLDDIIITILQQTKKPLKPILQQLISI